MNNNYTVEYLGLTMNFEPRKYDIDILPQPLSAIENYHIDLSEKVLQSEVYYSGTFKGHWKLELVSQAVAYYLRMTTPEFVEHMSEPIKISSLSKQTIKNFVQSVAYTNRKIPLSEADIKVARFYQKIEELIHTDES